MSQGKWGVVGEREASDGGPLDSDVRNCRDDGPASSLVTSDQIPIRVRVDANVGVDAGARVQLS